MLSPDSPKTVVRDTPVVPPYVPPGILHVPQNAGLLSEVPGPSVQSPTSMQRTPTRDVQHRTPTTGVQQRVPTTGVQSGTPTKGPSASTQRCYPVRSRAPPLKFDDLVVGSK